MIDKNYCLSSYMAFRYIDDDGKDFYDGMHHKNIVQLPDSEKTFVKSSHEIGEAIQRQLLQFEGKKKGIMLSGGMDSAIIASYMGDGEAYTFRFLDGSFQKEELERAEYYAKRCNLNLHYVDITWDTVVRHVDACMRSKCAPVHSIEPQILQAAMQAKADGVEVLLIGDGSDYVFGGMDKLLSKDWDFDAFVKRYYSIDPQEVLNDPVDMSYAFEPFRKDNNKIDFWGFMQGLTITESYSSYMNAFSVAGMAYCDPYARLKMSEPIDLQRIRRGESKYLIRELMSSRYPDVTIPEKNPMPRPVDIYFANWEGPSRKEFKANLDMTKFTGNQKWQLWCAERFMNMFEAGK